MECVLGHNRSALWRSCRRGVCDYDVCNYDVKISIKALESISSSMEYRIAVCLG